MANFALGWWIKIRETFRKQDVPSMNAFHDTEDYVPHANDYPIFPPASPRAICQDPGQYWVIVSARKFGAPQGVFEDTSLYALYRLYEYVVLDRVISYRNALEVFWRQKEWLIADIPDPMDDDPERYAFLAGCTYLLVQSFNARIKLGLRRDMPSIITPEEAEEARNIPDELRPYEKVPQWAQEVAPLAETLVVPTHDGVLLDGKDDERVDPDFLAKNILLWTPHIHFT